MPQAFARDFVLHLQQRSVADIMVYRENSDSFIKVFVLKPSGVIFNIENK